MMISDSEMQEFLNRNGWKVYEVDDFDIESVHGSKIEYVPKTVLTAEKDGIKMNLYQAFEKELKNKILQL